MTFMSLVLSDLFWDVYHCENITTIIITIIIIIENIDKTSQKTCKLELFFLLLHANLCGPVCG